MRMFSRLALNLSGVALAGTLALAACGRAATPASPAEAAPLRFEQITMGDGTRLEYAVATPAGYDPARSYPVLLALPPGGQDKQVTESLMRRLWADEGPRRGWIVISPVAPQGRLFFEGSERYIPELLDATAERYRPEGGAYFLAGVSNGGLSAFRAAIRTPERFRALIALPGFPYSDADKQQLGALRSIPVALYVGADDSGWREEAQATYQALVAQGGAATLDLVPNEGHIIRSLTSQQLFDRLESFR